MPLQVELRVERGAVPFCRTGGHKTPRVLAEDLKLCPVLADDQSKLCQRQSLDKCCGAQAGCAHTIVHTQPNKIIKTVSGAAVLHVSPDELC